jgi:ankyrin repeat protein
MDFKEVYTKLFDLIINHKDDLFIDQINKIKDNPLFDIDIRDDNGLHFLNYAIISNNTKIVKFLIDLGARLDIENLDESSILRIPILYGYNEMLELLLAADIKSIGTSIVSHRDKHYRIPLHYAIISKNIKAINLLLSYKSNPNITDKDGYNSLFHSVRSRSLEICKIILPLISNINARSVNGENALHVACNYKLHSIAELLIKAGININAYDNNNEITPLHYSILIGDSVLVELLISNHANINVQDAHGNTPLHYAILENKNEILDLILDKSVVVEKLIFNLWNIHGEIPLHVYLKNRKDENGYISLLIKKSNLNLQDKNGNSCLYYIVVEGLWKKYTDILLKKKLDIFTKNKQGNRVIDLISESEYKQFMDLVVDSYMYNLKHLGKSWTDEWDIICAKSFNDLTENERNKISKGNLNDDVFIKKCKIGIHEKIEKLLKQKDKEKEPCHQMSYPIVKPVICVNINEGQNLSFCTFTGNLLDVLIGIVYLLKTHKNVCAVSPSNPNELFSTSGNRSKYELSNFEIIWSNKKLTMTRNFKENFQMCVKSKRFVIIPLGIEMNNASHSNYLVYDSFKKELERFETYGAGFSLYGTYYNPELLDELLQSKFQEIDNEIKYIRPNEYLPKISFQLFDIVEKEKKRIHDPVGFCSLWSIWWVDQRLTYQDIDRKDLAEILINLIKRQGASFKNMIRNYSLRIIKIRDKLLHKSKMNINDWINDQYDNKQYFQLIDNIYAELKGKK